MSSIISNFLPPTAVIMKFQFSAKLKKSSFRTDYRVSNNLKTEIVSLEVDMCVFKISYR